MDLKCNCPSFCAERDESKDESCVCGGKGKGEGVGVLDTSLYTYVAI